MSILIKPALSTGPILADSLLSFAGRRAFKPYPGTIALAEAVRATYPGGVDAILIGLRPVPGFLLSADSKGIIAILIGLLLPAVQSVREASSPELRTFKSLLKPGGSIGIAMCDGSVMPVGAQSAGKSASDLGQMMQFALQDATSAL